MDERFIEWIKWAISYLDEVILRIQSNDYDPFQELPLDYNDWDIDEIKKRLLKFLNPFTIHQGYFEELKAIDILLRNNKKHNHKLMLSLFQVKLLEEIRQLLEQENSKRENPESIKMKQTRLDKYNSILKEIENGNIVSIETEVIMDLVEDLSMTSSMKMMFLHDYAVFTKSKIGTHEEKNISRLDKTQVELLFGKYGYSFGEVSKTGVNHILMNGNMDNMEKIFKALENNKIGYMIEKLPVFPSFITYSSSDIINDIVNRIGNISISRLSTIPNVFVPSDKGFGSIKGAYENFISNLELFKNNLDIVFKKAPELLLIPTNELRLNMELGKAYGLDVLDNIHFLPMLVSKDLTSVLDSYIEEDAYDYAVVNPSRLISRGDVHFYRMKYARINNIEGYKRTFKDKSTQIWMHGAVFKKNGFDITDENKRDKTDSITLGGINEEYDRIVRENKSTSFASMESNPFIVALEPYLSKNRPYTYEFGSTLISAPKVLRIFYSLYIGGVSLDYESLLYAITYNSILTSDEMEYIKGIVSSLEIGMVR